MVPRTVRCQRANPTASASSRRSTVTLSRPTASATVRTRVTKSSPGPYQRSSWGRGVLVFLSSSFLRITQSGMAIAGFLELKSARSSYFGTSRPRSNALPATCTSSHSMPLRSASQCACSFLVGALLRSSRRAMNAFQSFANAAPLAASGVMAASTFQYSSGWNARISRSRSTMSRSATLCTRPALSPPATFFHSTGLTM